MGAKNIVNAPNGPTNWRPNVKSRPRACRGGHAVDGTPNRCTRAVPATADLRVAPWHTPHRQIAFQPTGITRIGRSAMR